MEFSQKKTNATDEATVGAIFSDDPFYTYLTAIILHAFYRVMVKPMSRSRSRSRSREVGVSVFCAVLWCLQGDHLIFQYLRLLLCPSHNVWL